MVFGFIFIRQVIRQKGYLQKDVLCSVSGLVLDESLLHFSATSIANMRAYMCSLEAEGLKARRKFTPIFVTPEERVKYADISTHTNAKLLEMAGQLIDDLDNPLHDSYCER